MTARNIKVSAEDNNVSGAQLLIINTLLSHGKYDEVLSKCQQLLTDNDNLYQLHWIVLLATYQCNSEQQLIDNNTTIDNIDMLDKVYQHAPDSMIQQYNDTLLQLICNTWQLSLIRYYMSNTSADNARHLGDLMFPVAIERLDITMLQLSCGSLPESSTTILARRQYAFAQALVNKGKFDKALDYMNNAMLLDDDSPDYQLLRFVIDADAPNNSDKLTQYILSNAGLSASTKLLQRVRTSQAVELILSNLLRAIDMPNIAISKVISAYDHIDKALAKIDSPYICDCTAQLASKLICIGAYSNAQQYINKALQDNNANNSLALCSILCNAKKPTLLQLLMSHTDISSLAAYDRACQIDSRLLLLASKQTILRQSALTHYNSNKQGISQLSDSLLVEMSIAQLNDVTTALNTQYQLQLANIQAIKDTAQQQISEIDQQCQYHRQQLAIIRKKYHVSDAVWLLLLLSLAGIIAVVIIHSVNNNKLSTASNPHSQYLAKAPNHIAQAKQKANSSIQQYILDNHLIDNSNLYI